MGAQKPVTGTISPTYSQVADKLDQQTVKAEDAEAERAEAVKLLICEKERARRADDARCQVRIPPLHKLLASLESCS